MGLDIIKCQDGYDYDLKEISSTQLISVINNLEILEHKHDEYFIALKPITYNSYLFEVLQKNNLHRLKYNLECEENIFIFIYNNNNLSKLKNMFNTFPDSIFEVQDIYFFNTTKTILEWIDIFSNNGQIAITNNISEEIVKKFCRNLACSYHLFKD